MNVKPSRRLHVYFLICLIFKQLFQITIGLRASYINYTSAVLISALSFNAYANSTLIHDESHGVENTSTAVQLAQVYNNENIQHYLVSEKYDGIRAIWKNNQLRTRTGNVIHAPKWFTENLPKVWLDGELWHKRESFEFVASAVTKDTPIDQQWQQITYMVFDAPNPHNSFEQRAKFYTDLLSKLNIAHVKPVEQFRLTSNKALMALLLNATANGSEGLMLQKAKASFADGRSGNLLKLKKYMDAEATVLKHLPGKGKYKNSMGAMLVEYVSDASKLIRFKIGTGFTDAQRSNPPPIGSTVTFAYHGYTKRGIPRFASFIRVSNKE